MIKVEGYEEPKPNFVKSVIRYMNRRFAALRKPKDYEFIPEYRKFKLNPENYILNGHGYIPNFRKTMGKPRYLRANTMAYLILEYKREIEGLRVFRGKIYFNGDIIRSNQQCQNYETSVIERFLDFCFFYLSVKVDEQQHNTRVKNNVKMEAKKLRTMARNKRKDNSNYQNRLK